MKELMFQHGRLAALKFDAETVSVAPEENGFLITAEGNVAVQDMPFVEAMLAGDFTCLFTVSEDGVELLSGRYQVTLLLLEPDKLAARIRPAG
jgi:hypothetical protein